MLEEWLSKAIENLYCWECRKLLPAKLQFSPSPSPCVSICVFQLPYLCFALLFIPLLHLLMSMLRLLISCHTIPSCGEIEAVATIFLNLECKIWEIGENREWETRIGMDCVLPMLRNLLCLLLSRLKTRAVLEDPLAQKRALLHFLKKLWW